MAASTSGRPCTGSPVQQLRMSAAVLPAPLARIAPALPRTSCTPCAHARRRILTHPICVAALLGPQSQAGMQQRTRMLTAAAGRGAGGAPECSSSDAPPSTSMPSPSAAAPLPAGMRLRRMRAGDVPGLALLDTACHADGSAGWSEGIFEAELQSQHPQGASIVLVLVLEAGSLIIGLAAGSLVVGELQITNLAVSQHHRRGGLGRLLTMALLQEAGPSLSSAVLEVSAHNSRAQGLYARMGFEPAGRRKRYYADGSDAIIMLRQGPAP